MSCLRLQKRLAADILRVGFRKVWLDSNEIHTIGEATTRASIRNLIKDGIIFRKPTMVHTTFRLKQRKKACNKGRHSGLGKRKGTAESRCPKKKLWQNRMRVLRSLLKRYRLARKIDKYMYHQLYMQVKGNVFKNRKVLMEHIFKKKQAKERSKKLADEANARRVCAKQARLRREARIALKLSELSKLTDD